MPEFIYEFVTPQARLAEVERRLTNLENTRLQLEYDAESEFPSGAAGQMLSPDVETQQQGYQQALEKIDNTINTFRDKRDALKTEIEAASGE